MHVGIVTCVELPEPDPDQQLLLDALQQAGLNAEMIAWDDTAADPGDYDVCVFRSCWNYHWFADAFRKWVDRAEQVTRLVNSARVVHWNLHKCYLRELDASGVPTIPTAWFDRGAAADLARTLSEFAWEQIVVKPAVSAGSFRTQQFHINELSRAQAFLDDLLCDADAMVQRYMPSFETPGERAVIWIDGEPTHAVTKSPRFADGVEQVSAAMRVTKAERMIAQKCFEIINESLLYARVDVVEDRAGELLVSELELVEPSLFFLQCPAALDRFVGAMQKIAGS